LPTSASARPMQASAVWAVRNWQVRVDTPLDPLLEAVAAFYARLAKSQ